MLLSEFVKSGTSDLESLYSASEARSIVLMLCSEVLGTQNYTYVVDPEYKVDEKKLPILRGYMSRLMQGEPIQYVLSKADFMGNVFKVTKDVLIPRQETELLCTEAIKVASRIERMRSPYGKDAKPVTVLDLCTGSGCIAWTLALSVKNCRVVGVDISDGALEVAASQDFSAQLKSKEAVKPVFVKADILDTEQDFPYGPFDLILSNPPYIMESEKSEMRRNVLDYEPYAALFVPDDDPLLFYRAIARWSQHLLSPDGFGMTEVNETLARQTETIFKGAGFGMTEIVKDLNDKNRFVVYRKV